MYKPIQQNEFVFASLITVCLIAINPYLALIGVISYAIARSRIF